MDELIKIYENNISEVKNYIIKMLSLTIESYIKIDKEKDLCSHFSVQALPTLFFIPVGGKPIIEVGATPEKYVQIIEEQLLK